MAQEEVIGLRIQLNGMNTVIQDVETLEKLLREANQDLKQVPIGSNNFKQLKQEIANTEKQLSELNNEQRTLKKDTREFAEVGNAITGAFAGAAAAIALFGGESKEITEAQKFASEALTVVLTAQSLAQIKLGDATLKTIIQQKAQTLATNTSNTALKGLYDTMKANPIGVLIVGITALAAAFAFLGSETDDYETQLESLNNSLNRSKDVFNSYTQALQAGTAEGLAILQRDGASFEEITTFKRQQIQLQIDALKTQKDREIEISNDLQTLRINQVLSEAAWSLEYLGISKDTTAEVNKIRLEGQVEREKIERSYNDKIEALQSQSATLLIERQIHTNEEIIKNQKETNDALLKLYEERLKFQLFYLEQLANLNETEAEAADDVIDRAQKVLQKLENLRKQRQSFFISDTQTFKDEIDSILFDTATDEDFNLIQSAFLSGYDTISKAILDGTLKIVDDNGKAISFSYEKLKDIIDQSDLPQSIKDKFDLLNKQQQKSLSEYFTRYAQTADKYSKQFKIADYVFTISDQKDIQSNLLKLIQGTSEILENEDILPGQRDIALRQLVLDIFKFPEKEAKDFKTAFDDGRIGLNAYNEGINDIISNLVEFGLVQNNSIQSFEDLKIELQDITSEITNINTELSTTIRLTDEEISTFTDKIGAKVRGNADLLKVFVQDVVDNIDKYTTKFGTEGLVRVFNALALNLDKIEGLTEKQLRDLLAMLIETRDIIVKEFGEGSAQSIEDLINRILGQIEKVQKESLKNAEGYSDEYIEKLNKITKRIQQFQQVVGQLGTLLGDSFSFQLEKLETNYNNALNGIVGDTKQANDKRLELEKGYQQEKKEIEKKARLTSLKITLAETLASGAQAVVEALKLPPPASYILAGINGTISAAQAVLVGQQIQFVNSLRRGGRLAGGGIAIGPSHENGGIYAGGGSYIEGNEAVVNRQSTIKYSSLLSSINQAEGGRPILVGNAMDSRLIEVLAKQKQEPIRAYVIEQDITKAQTINRKLEQLASF